MKLYIMNYGYLDMDGNEYSLGGVDTYISMLVEVAKEMNIDSIVYQFANRDFIINLKNTTVVGVKIDNNWSLRKKKKILFNSLKKDFNAKEDVLIFATDYINVKNNFNRVICIQHGVAWDIQRKKQTCNLLNKLYIFKAALGAYIKSIRYDYSKVLVCVDYNFLNWYRTQVARIRQDIYVIPNAAKCNENYIKDDNNIVKIIFARRLYEYRGTRIFIDSITKILEEFNNIQITIAGEGPDKEYMKEKLKNYDNVSFIKYNANESIKIHSKHDIAIVPTTGSEGTSLSLLEAMSSSCAVITTNIGGLTNIIINNYNGLLISPNSSELYIAIRELIVNENLRKRLSKNARDSVELGFNFEVWKESWKKVIQNTISRY
ncbi:glycosyltransferase family 4 protein [Clostridium perfringens]|uniref:glycosyltransferase family 4 protein n=1 Tax=Clostridium perfringens TaxID=1502 RepID=UPI0018E459F3|nr:glycosyltransferase family 4 protein [Clostridium perfringens]EIF6174297.1 glycosyltransferase family 4 protein [Clostridium perfringens]MBI6047913.1 glycosyltransferase family 4 protein [Clostridium perfringens]MDM0806577.1 glycosyltransferase family 4 protein [Clostridium perfringens]